VGVSDHQPTDPGSRAAQVLALFGLRLSWCHSTRLKQPLPRLFDQEPVSGRAPDVVLAFVLDDFRVFFLVVQARVEGLGLPGRVEVPGQLPGLKDLPDLGGEGGDFRPEVGVRLGRFEDDLARRFRIAC
jgi:hypothetical protein